MESDLEMHWEVVAEGAQTILRAANISSGYDRLKFLTRGKEITQEIFYDWIDQVDAEYNIKVKLRQLSPMNYIGLSKQSAEQALKAFDLI